MLISSLTQVDIMKTIDLSKIHTGKEFAETIFSSKDFCFQLLGENENPVLNKINEPELTPKFTIGDSVKLDSELSLFNGVENNEEYKVIGLELVDNQVLYSVKNNTGKYTFFGYELELVN